MIPADHILVDGDTAWLVFTDDLAGDRLSEWRDRDDYCGMCDGHSAADWSVGLGPCPDCDDGRHTFDVEVDTGERYVTHDRTQATNRLERRRVSVVPGMVLPIVEADDSDYGPIGKIEWHGPDWHCAYLWTDDGPVEVTLPPAAAPGMWAVKLRVAS